MITQLRGHHLLCLLGFQGMGYSPEFAANMARIHARLRAHPETGVEIVTGADSLCACFPKDQVNHCGESPVSERDARVLERLGLAPGARLPWRDIWKRLQESVEPADIDAWCLSCPWRPYGVCAAGVARMKIDARLSAPETRPFQSRGGDAAHSRD